MTVPPPPPPTPGLGLPETRGANVWTTMNYSMTAPERVLFAIRIRRFTLKLVRHA